MRWMVSYNTDIGKRQKNEDSLFIKIMSVSAGQVLFSAVCDGVGGLDNGAIASEAVTDALINWFECNMAYIASESLNSQELYGMWRSCIVNINRILLSYGEKNGLKLGTTMSAILLVNNSYYAMHIGDSRIYQIADNIEQITEDQSLVMKELKSGLITEEQAKKDNRKNIILQCIGSTLNIKPVFYEGKLKKDAVILLCSDGLIHEITQDELKKYFAFHLLVDEKMMKNQILKATELVKKRNEQDNISAVLIKAIY